MPAASPLDSPSIGTAANDLIESCRRAQPAPAVPDPPADGRPPLAVAFSGGGFRATLAAVGVARFLADAGLLRDVRYVSSVSGGSVALGLLACAWDELRADDFSPEAFDRRVVGPLLGRISRESLTAHLFMNAWRMLGGSSRTDLLSRLFADWFFGARRLEELPAGVRFIFNAANLDTGVRFGFERDVAGDYVLGLVATAGSGLRVAQAAAASAAVPGPFVPMVVELPFPCAHGRKGALVDGGTYDNLGLEPLNHLRDAYLVAINAGGLFHTRRASSFPVVALLERASGLLYRQTTALRTREMVERFRAWEAAVAEGREPPPFARQGALFGLATTMGDKATPEWLAGRPEPSREEIVELAEVATSFGKFEPQLCEKLIHRGWWLTGAVVSRYRRDLLDALPRWRPLP